MSKQNLRFIVTSTFLPIVNNQLDLAFVNVKNTQFQKQKKQGTKLIAFTENSPFRVLVEKKKFIHRFHQIFVKLNVA